MYLRQEQASSTVRASHDSVGQLANGRAVNCFAARSPPVRPSNFWQVQKRLLAEQLLCRQVSLLNRRRRAFAHTQAAMLLGWLST
jgi:hypothetical protein